MAQARAAQRLRRLPARWTTYALLTGSVVAILAAGLILPAAVGHPEGAAIATVAPPVRPVLPPPPPRDHDPRPVPRYATVPLVTSPRPPSGTVLTASDVGVTPTTITFGVILPSLGVIANFGIDVSQLNPKIQRGYWQSAINRINAAGGIDGRRLIADYTTASILSPDSMRAACRTLTEDDRVFAVANVLGVTGDPILCVTRDHATPYIGIDGEDPSAYQISQGRLVTFEPSSARTLSILVGRLSQMGLLRGRRVGVVHDTVPGEVPGSSIKAALRAAGVKTIVDGPLGNQDALTVTGEVAAAEQHMRAAGVDTVLFFTNAVFGTVFGTQAAADNYRPTFVVGDLGFATAGDAFVGNMPVPFFRQALAVATPEIGRGRGGLPESPLDGGCRLAYQRFIGHTVDRDGQDAVAAIASCAVVQLLTMGLTGAGPNPTRPAFTTALDSFGSFAVPGFGRALLTPGHLDAADEVLVAEGHADCQCWYAVDGYRPAASVATGGS
jgi:ABC-type branched-subunit amino acid transport system substrate-binding protein